MDSRLSKPSAHSTMLLLALVACTLGTFPFAVHAHASLTTPESRNVRYFTSSGGLPGQGLGAWYANGGNGLGPTPFRPAGNPGVCGDPYQESPITNIANFAGPVTTYSSGQTVRVTVRLQVNHGGRLTFRLCDRKTNLDQSCFNARPLLRADNNKPNWYILTGSWANTNAGNPEFASYDIKLPAGFSCTTGCVLQMEYFTYNTCMETCPREECGFYADRRNQITGQAGPLDICYTGGPPPEIFRNCADIVINGGGGTPPPSGGVCDKCNLPAMSGGCKCDSNCNCLPGTGGAKCDKCNIPVASGGCQCNSNCDCIASGCSTTCPTPTTQCQTGGGCNTATRTCNPITNRANGVACSGGTCQNGVCQTSSTSCTNPPGQTQATCVCSRSSLGYYQDTFNGCRGGIWCYSGGSQYVPCATGTLYDANLKVCNWASQVSCPAVRTASAAAATSRTTASRRARAGVTRNPAQTAEEAAAAAVAASAAAAALPAGPVDDTVVDATAATAPSAVVVAPAAVGAEGMPVAEPTAAAVDAPVGDVAAATAAAVVTEAGAVVPDAAAAVAP